MESSVLRGMPRISQLFGGCR